MINKGKFPYYLSYQCSFRLEHNFYVPLLESFFYVKVNIKCKLINIQYFKMDIYIYHYSKIHIVDQCIKVRTTRHAGYNITSCCTSLISIKGKIVYYNMYVHTIFCWLSFIFIVNYKVVLLSQIKPITVIVKYTSKFMFHFTL